MSSDVFLTAASKEHLIKTQIVFKDLQTQRSVDYIVQMHRSSVNVEHRYIGRIIGRRLLLGHASTFDRTSVIIMDARSA